MDCDGEFKYSSNMLNELKGQHAKCDLLEFSVIYSNQQKPMLNLCGIHQCHIYIYIAKHEVKP